MRQNAFEFGDDFDLREVRERLLKLYGPQRDRERFDPLDQLVYGVLASRTRDEVSMKAFWRLKTCCPDWETLIDMPSDAIEPAIVDVTFAEKKAIDLPIMLTMLRAQHGLDLEGRLAGEDEEAAMQILTALHGVKFKIAATVLNFSTLRKRVLAVDTHLLRVGERLGFVPLGGLYEDGYEAYARLLPDDWAADDLYELHWLIKKLGQNICHHTVPHCSACPLRDVCPARDFSPAVA
jgi:endonuclease-3